MAEFKVPELGENVAQGDVTRVLVKVGDTITNEQPVLELETDKATIEVPSSVAGVVKEIKVKEGDKVKVGAVILTVDDAGRRRLPRLRRRLPAPAAAPPRQPSRRSRTASRARAAPAASGDRSDAASCRCRGSVCARGAAPQPRRAVQPDGERGPAAPAAPSVRRLAREIGVDINDDPGHRARAGASRRKTSRSTRAGS